MVEIWNFFVANCNPSMYYFLKELLTILILIVIVSHYFFVLTRTFRHILLINSFLRIKKQLKKNSWF
jgi:hypothetical protein